MFTEFWQWQKQVQSRYNVPIASAIPSRESVVTTISTHYSINNLQPKTVNILLPGIGRLVPHHISSFRHCLYSLLTDTRLQSDDCYLFANDNPLQPPPFPNPEEPHNEHIFSDIDSGSRFHQCWEQHCKNPEKDLLCPIIFYADTTFTDTKGKLTLEPLSFTLGIYNRATRNKEYAWRTIGYIPKARYNSKCTSDQKIKDYHTSIRHLLDEFIQSQLSGGIDWNIKYKGGQYKVTLQIPVMFIIGDTEGHDKMCARTGSYTLTCQRLCRACNCPPDKADDEMFNYTYTIQSDAKNAYNNKQTQVVAQMSLFNIYNAWWDVSFGGCERGIYGAVPGEVLHFLQQGLHQRLKLALLKAKKMSQLARKRVRAADLSNQQQNNNRSKKKHPHGTETYYEPPGADDKIKQNVFNPKTTTVLEEYAKK
jgi:hypothetical protein